MDEWLEEDMDLLTGGEPAPRVLDQRMIREPIRYVAPRPPLCLAPSDTVIDAIRTMREHRIGCVLVVEGERLVGIVTERDFIMKLGQADAGRPLSDFMTPDPEVLSPDDPIVYALNKMSVGGFRHVPLVDEARRPVGVVSAKDIIDYIADFFPNDVLTVPPAPARGARGRRRPPHDDRSTHVTSHPRVLSRPETGSRVANPADVTPSGPRRPETRSRVVPPRCRRGSAGRRGRRATWPWRRRPAG